MELGDDEVRLDWEVRSHKLTAGAKPPPAQVISNSYPVGKETACDMYSIENIFGNHNRILAD